MKNYAAAVKQKHLAPSVNTAPPRPSDVSNPRKQARVDLTPVSAPFAPPRRRFAARTTTPARTAPPQRNVSTVGDAQAQTPLPAQLSYRGGFVNPRPKYAALFSYPSYRPNLVVPLEDEGLKEIHQPVRYVAPNPTFPTPEEWQRIGAHNRSIGAAFRTDRPAPFKQCCKGHLQPFLLSVLRFCFFLKFLFVSKSVLPFCFLLGFYIGLFCAFVSLSETSLFFLEFSYLYS